MPAVYATVMGLAGEHVRCIAALRQSLALPSGVLERRTILLQDLVVAAATLVAKDFTGPVRDGFVRDVREWVAEACDLPGKTAGECYAIYHAAHYARSDRLPELVACWNRLAPEDPSARLALAEVQVNLGNHRLPLQILESLKPETLPKWQHNWARNIRDAARRHAAEATVEKPRPKKPPTKKEK